MGGIIEFVGRNGAVQIFGVKLVGVTSENGKKLLFTIAFIAVMMLIGRGLRLLIGLVARGRAGRSRFWARQGVHLFTAALVLIGVCSIWFDDPVRLATALGLVTAGLAFALQRVVTAVAAYFVILRGQTFNVGDRIVMGQVRGDVIALGFIQTTIMEMGQPPPVQNADPAMWVQARQYTGRIVVVTNDKIFDTPVYNYSREFPYIWEEIRIPVSLQSDWKRAEAILLETARRHTVKISELGESDLAEIERRYAVRRADLDPRVFFRLTDNWLEMSVRFLAEDHGVRELKDAMSREILNEFTGAGIGIASGTYDVVGFPPVRVRIENPETPEGAARHHGERVVKV
jgi:small-conductance mechanosensitive channel